MSKSMNERWFTQIYSNHLNYSAHDFTEYNAAYWDVYFRSNDNWKPDYKPKYVTKKMFYDIKAMARLVKLNNERAWRGNSTPAP